MAGWKKILLDGSAHSDTVAQTVSRGSLIYGNSTPKWDELIVGAANSVLWSDGTDVSWSAAPQLANIADTGTAPGTNRITLATSSPQMTLTGNVQVNGDILMGTDASLLNAYIRIFSLAAESAHTTGIYQTLTYSGSSNTITGISGGASVASGNTNNISTVLATTLSAGHSGSGLVTDLRAVFLTVSVGASAKVTNASIFRVSVTDQSTSIDTVNMLHFAGRPKNTKVAYRGFFMDGTTNRDTGATTTLGEWNAFENAAIAHNGAIDSVALFKSAGIGGTGVARRYGMTIGDLTTNMGASHASFGMQYDLQDATALGEQWLFYYGDKPWIFPTKVFFYDGATFSDDTIEALTTDVKSTIDTGITTAVTNNTVTDSAKAWISNQFQNQTVRITSGTGIRQVRRVTSNTATRLTVTPNWSTNPAVDDTFTVGGGFEVLTDTGDFFYVGHSAKFRRIFLDLDTLGAGATLVFQYWNGAWTTLTPVTDRTTNLTADGSLEFAAPSDWVTTAINSSTQFWVRLSTSANPSTFPTAKYVTIRTDTDPKLGIDTAGQIHNLLYETGAFSAANGNNNDIAINSDVWVHITGPTGVFTITGIAGGVDGRRLYLYNAVAQDMTIANENASSTAANRITTLTGADVTLTGVSVTHFVYDGTDSRWIMTGSQG